MSKSIRAFSMYYMFLSVFLYVIIRTVMCQSPASSPLSSPPVPPLSSPAASPPAPSVASPPAPPISSPVASPPAPAGPANITAILEKAGGFKTMIKLLESTHVGDHIYTQLNDSKQGMTVFVPSDNAFTALKAGTLNRLNDQQQVSLILFHVLSSFIPLTQFQTVSNPIRTQAGDTGSFQYPLNIITMDKQVNISTGVINATVVNPIYSDNQLAVYQVDKVLLPQKLFGPKPPAPAPAPAEAPAAPKKKKKSSTPAAELSSDDFTSGDVGFNPNEAVSLAAATIAIFWL